jgi:hypothetical protein
LRKENQQELGGLLTEWLKIWQIEEEQTCAEDREEETDEEEEYSYEEEREEQTDKEKE